MTSLPSLEEGLKAHPDRSTLIEEARRHLPTPTIETNRQHPSYPHQTGAHERYQPVAPTKKWNPPD